jgi:diaminopimelate epimerase
MVGPVSLAFSKYEGAGNDFIMVLDLEDEMTLTSDEVAALCDRRTGIGADGLIRVLRGLVTTALGSSARGETAVAGTDPEPDVTMDYRNADGSPAEMCGNGLRCVGKFLHDRGLAGDQIAVATRAGVRHLQLHGDAGGQVRQVTATMGLSGPVRTAIAISSSAPGLSAAASAVSIGNPHLVVQISVDPANVPVESIGPVLERDERFPEGTNVEFAYVDPAIRNVVTRVWERGSGETMACGSGACAVAVVLADAGLATWPVTVRFPGGELVVERAEDGELSLRGPVRHVFDGTVAPMGHERAVSAAGAAPEDATA